MALEHLRKDGVLNLNDDEVTEDEDEDVARDVEALPVVPVPQARLLSTKPVNKSYRTTKRIECDLTSTPVLVLREHCPVFYLTLSYHRDQSCIRPAQKSW